MKKFVFLTVLGLFLTVFLANSFAGEANQFVRVENNALLKQAQRSYILANDGAVLTRLYLENREDVPLQNVPPVVQKAFIAIEDERYYQHKGVDVYGIARAVVTDLKHRQIVEGGSTITQQYVKNSIGSKDRTLTRKMREAVMAARLEQKYSKQQILEAYLNTIYFGQGAYGIEAASEVFFGKKSYQLTLAEGALLAGVTKSPENFSPYKNLKNALSRRATVLDRMASLKLITKHEADQAKATPLRVAALRQEPVSAPYFVEYVKQALIKEYGVNKVFKGGLRVHTTLSWRAQRIAERAVAKRLYLRKDPQAALVSINPKNGYIVAMIGGRNFQHIKYNLATQGKRQPGSSFKPFVLITALKQGYGPNDTFDSSSPQTIRISRNPYDEPWTVHNCEGSGHGMMTLREATVHSVNAVYANLTVTVGPDNVVETAHQMGITTHLDPYPSLGIGGLTVGVSPLEMASAYATLANGGVHIPPTSIIKIVDSEGTTIKQAKPVGTQAISAEIANRAIDIMQGVVQRGTATRANIGRPAAGKTGTNGEYRDAWFVGFTPNLVTSVWMGYPQAQVSMYNVHGSRGFGGIIPASIWHSYMGQFLSGTPVLDFTPARWPGNQAKKASSYSGGKHAANFSGSGSNASKRRSLQHITATQQPNPTLQPGTTQGIQQTPQTPQTVVTPTNPPTTAAPPGTATNPPTSGQAESTGH
ncbi:MAG: transglycosylase domain-containing protein [Candidatus Aquicultor sp.]